MPNGKGELDPYGIFRALEGHGVRYVVIGALGQVIRGAQTITDAIDIVPHPRANELQRLEDALAELEAQRCDGHPLVVDLEALSREPVVRLATSAGGVGIVLEPAGTRGYHDLRRRATREAIGEGLSPSFASIGDLARMSPPSAGRTRASGFESSGTSWTSKVSRGAGHGQGGARHRLALAETKHLGWIDGMNSRGHHQ